MPYGPMEETDTSFLDSELYSRHAELKDQKDFEAQRGTPIPAMLNQFYKFIQNPSTVSVETFKRMIDTDDTAGSGMDFLSMCLAARRGNYVHESQEITEFVNQALKGIDGGFHNAQKEMYSAAWAGFSTQEIVWANTDLGFVPRKLVTLPPSTILFEVERTGELSNDGVLQYQRNFNPGFAGASNGMGFGFSTISGAPSRPDPLAKLGDLPFPIRTGNAYSYMAIRIPRQKVLHYAFDAQGRFQNPYGRSLLRRAYKYYVMKDAILQMLIVALDRKGTPLTIVYYNPDLTLVDEKKAGANAPIGGTMGNPNMGIRAGVAAREAFKNVHNDSTIFLPGKKEQHFNVEKMDVTSNAGDFIAALDFCNKSLMRAMLLPGLIFGTGDGSGSWALGEQHAKTFDKLCDSMNAGADQVLTDQLISQMIKYNFPESAWKKDGFGTFSKRELSPDEQVKEMEIVEKGVNVGAIDMNDLTDLNQVRDKMGFEALKKVPEKNNPAFGHELDQEAADAAHQREQEAAAQGGELGNADKKAKEQKAKMAQLAAAITVRDVEDLIQFAGARIVTVGLVAEGKYTLAGRRRDNGKWTNPGGHMEPGEDVHAAACREVLEETGITITPDQLKAVRAEKIVSHRTGKPFVVFAFVASIDKLTATNEADPDNEISEWSWVPLERNRAELMPENRHAKQDFVLDALFSDTWVA